MTAKLKLKKNGKFQLTMCEDDVSLIDLLVAHCQLGQDEPWSKSAFSILRAIEKCEEKENITIRDDTSYLHMIVQKNGSDKVDVVCGDDAIFKIESRD
jgi:hypothetical protein